TRRREPDHRPRGFAAWTIKYELGRRGRLFLNILGRKRCGGLRTNLVEPLLTVVTQFHRAEDLQSVLCVIDTCLNKIILVSPTSAPAAGFSTAVAVVLAPGIV